MANTHKQCIITFKIAANAKQTEISGFLEDIVKIRVHAIRENGKANQELRSYLSSTLNIPKENIIFLTGTTSSTKRILFIGKIKEEIWQIFTQLLHN